MNVDFGSRPTWRVNRGNSAGRCALSPIAQDDICEASQEMIGRRANILPILSSRRLPELL